MHIIDEKRFYTALKKKGYRTIGELATSLGLHRNTIHYYLSGHGVFPEGLEKIIGALDLNVSDALLKKEEGVIQSFEPISPLIDALHSEFPDITFVLFGSRSKGKAKKYSDWDIGVYGENGLPHEIYRRIVERKDDLAENLPFFIDIVNLNRAEDYFLREASKYWTFLTGRLTGFLKLQRKAAGHER